ncbi:MAG: YkgJ family cysteine cluster protein [Deltaproteobacteria bacterium]|nr:YkgJ family cysteine cluster protein [Deltaproteobacteria bacterium]
MNVDLGHFFSKYEALVAQVDAAVHTVTQQYASEVRCRRGCSDCCHALFDVSLVEAMYINAHFSELSETRRNEILIEADKADRKAQIIKKKAYHDISTDPRADVLTQAAKERIRCPLLDVNNECSLYRWRPLTCRIYGIPMEIGGKSHTCGLSGFEPGRAYPSIKMERIQDQLVSLSNQMLATIGSSYQDFQFMHVPVSTALLTVYSHDFFGVDKQAESVGTEAGAEDA